MELSRTKNSIRNFKSTLLLQFINKIIAFIVRTVFIRTLNSEYLGVNGLFTDILTLLSFAELGIGTAIIFSMYEPISNNDVVKIKSLMKLYKKSYITIGIVIFSIGVCLIPFLHYLIKEVPSIKENIIIIYLLFVVNTTISYFFAYKKSIITAYQQESEINKISSVVILVKSLLEIIILITTKNYILYLIISIVATFFQNYAISIKAEHMFPYLNDKNVKELPKKEKKKIFSNVKSLIVYKVGSIILNGTDNIIMSAMINVVVVGLCSNYTMIINSVKSIMSNALNSITASIGNLNATSDKKKKEKILYELTLINYLTYSFISISFIILLNPLIDLWLGSKYVLGLDVLIAMSSSLFIEGVRLPAYTYRVTLGLFQKGRLTPFIATIVNIVSSIVLCYYLGIVGIFIGTCLAQLSSYSWIDAYLIHKYEFNTSVKKYYYKIAKYFILFVINVIIVVCISDNISYKGLLNLFVKFCIVLTIPNIINIIFLKKDKEFKSVKNKFVLPCIRKIVKTFN